MGDVWSHNGKYYFLDTPERKREWISAVLEKLSDNTISQICILIENDLTKGHRKSREEYLKNKVENF